MATIGVKMGMELLRNKGQYPGDPPVKKIYSYYNPMADKEQFAIYYDDYTLFPSPFVRNPALLFEDGEYTAEGLALLTGGEDYEE